MEGNARMEEIMMEIKEHLKPVIDHGAIGNIHHYNRVWEKIDAWFHRWDGKTVSQNGLPSNIVEALNMGDGVYRP